MPKNGITKEKIVNKAVLLIEKSGISNFSLQTLSKALNIKPASLYNHISGIDDLLIDVCLYALKKQSAAQLKAIEGKTGSDAIIALANAYRLFAKEHKHLYRLIINTAVSYGEKFSEISKYIVEPFFNVLEYTSLTEKEKIHWQRILRGIINGFISQEDAGFFSHFPADVNESFEIAIKCYIIGLKEAENRQ